LLRVKAVADCDDDAMSDPTVPAAAPVSPEPAGDVAADDSHVATAAELEQARAELADTRKAASRQLRAQRMREWRNRGIAVAIGLALLVILYFVAAAFLPRWWAHTVARQAHSSFAAGILWGLFYGIVFTFFPLLLAWQVRRRPLAWQVRVGMIVVALLLAIPNLLTLSVVVGVSKAASAGDRILDVDAPGFRGATLTGAIIGAVLVIATAVVGILLKRRSDEVHELRAQNKARLRSEKAKPKLGD
jgi:MFS family permease